VGYRDDTEAARLLAEALEREVAAGWAALGGGTQRLNRRVKRWLAWGNAAILAAAAVGFAVGAWLYFGGVL
jgi:hypothetical protein